MSNQLVKIIFDDDGEATNNDSWHLAVQPDGSPRTLCTGEVFGGGEGEAVYKTKSVERGGITCPKCLEIIKQFKAIKL